MKKKNIFWGLLLILAAVLIIVNEFGVFTTSISMFDIIATVILVGIIIISIFHVNFWGILFPLALISILYADEWNITHFTPWPALFTALLLSIGLSLIFKKHGFWGCHHHHFNHADGRFGKSVINGHDDNVIECTASFGECIKYVNSENFERADIRCSFGDVKVYFDNAQIPSGKADIYMDVSFGDVKLFIPRTWKVVNHVNVFLGDIDEKNANPGVDSPIVTINGNISFGDAKIIYV